MYDLQVKTTAPIRECSQDGADHVVSAITGAKAESVYLKPINQVRGKKDYSNNEKKNNTDRSEHSAILQKMRMCQLKGGNHMQDS